MSETKKVFDYWLKSVSENSRSNYSRIIPDFFEKVYEKKVDDITANDIDNLEKSFVYEKFVEPLMNEGKKNTTISNYLYVVRSYVKELKNNRVFREDGVDYDHCINTALSLDVKDDTTPRAKLTEGDYELFTEWLGTKFSGRYADKGIKYPLVTKFMFITAVRINATFRTIKWNNIKLEKDTYGIESYVVYASDKGGKINRKPITKEFYDEIKEAFYHGDDEDLVFGDLSKQGFTRLMKEYCDETGKDFSPHSLKVGAGTKLYRMTRDIYQVSRFLDHSSVEQTRQYIRVDDDVTAYGSYILSSDVSIEDIDKISSKDLKRIIQSDETLAYTIMNIAKSRGVLTNG